MTDSQKKPIETRLLEAKEIHAKLTKIQKQAKHEAGLVYHEMHTKLKELGYAEFEVFVLKQRIEAMESTIIRKKMLLEERYKGNIALAVTDLLEAIEKIEGKKI